MGGGILIGGVLPRLLQALDERKQCGRENNVWRRYDAHVDGDQEAHGCDAAIITAIFAKR